MRTYINCQEEKALERETNSEDVMLIEEQIPSNKNALSKSNELIDYSLPRKQAKLESPSSSDSISQVSNYSKKSENKGQIKNNKRPASRAWDHYEDHPNSKGRIRCKYCPKDPKNEVTYATGTSTTILLRHYTLHHTLLRAKN